MCIRKFRGKFNLATLICCRHYCPPFRVDCTKSGSKRQVESLKRLRPPFSSAYLNDSPRKVHAHFAPIWHATIWTNSVLCILLSCSYFLLIRFMFFFINCFVHATLYHIHVIHWSGVVKWYGMEERQKKRKQGTTKCIHTHTHTSTGYKMNGYTTVDGTLEPDKQDHIWIVLKMCSML